MSTPAPRPADLIVRVAHLERRQRVPQPVVVLAVAIVLAAVVGFTRGAPEVVQAQRVELVNAKGAVRATLAADTAGVTLTLLDERGRAVGSLRLNADPRLAVRDAAGRELAGLGSPRVQHLVQ